MKKHILLPVFLVIIACLVMGCDGSERTGGRCDYKDYEGIVIVKSIQRDSSDTSTGDADEINLVRFTFQAGGDVPPEVKKFSDEIELSNEQIDKKGVRVGKQFRTTASYIVSGTCDPGPHIEGPEKWH